MSIEVPSPPLDFPYDDPGVHPYLLHVQKPDSTQELLFVGVHHFNKSSDPQFPILTALWDYFASRPDAPWDMVVLQEGGARRTVGETPEESLGDDGEQAYIANLARRKSIHRRSAEPPDTWLSRQLVEYCGVELASYFEYMKFARQYIRAQEASADPQPFDLYVRSRASMDRRLTFDFLDFSLESLKATHRELFPDTPFDPLEPLPDGSFRTAPDYRKMFWPVDLPANSELTPLQEIGLQFDLLRDKWLMEDTLISAWEFGVSIFDMHGVSHAVTVEAVLGEVLNAPLSSYVGAAACYRFLKEKREERQQRP